MAVDSTLLLEEVQQVVNSGEGLSHYRLECRLRAGGEWFSPVRLDLYSLERDYENSFGDVVVLRVIVGLGEYSYKLLPNRDDLWVDVTSTPLYENSGTERDNTTIRVRRYRAILMDQENPGLTGSGPQASSSDDMDLSAPKTVELQLIDDGLYQTRMVSVGKLYRNAVPMDVLRSLFTETTRLLDTNGEQQIFGVTVTPDYATTPRENLVIPHGTPLTAVPSYLQEQEGGIYGAGLSCYLQRGQWYVFPPYDTQRVSKSRHTLTILNIPANRYLGAERTYRIRGKEVVIISAGGKQSNDPGLYSQLNEGNATRFTDARRLMTFGDTNNNQTQIKRQDNVFEAQGTGLKSGLTHARWADERASGNPLHHYSRMAQRQGRYMSIRWDHGDGSLLVPGMPVKYMTTADEKLVVVHGVLLGLHEQRQPNEGGVGQQQYPAKIILKVFLSRQEAV